MDAARILREARRRAGLSQRRLGEKAGVAQPTIARIERGAIVPRVDTLDRLLEACGEGLYARERIGVGIDRSLIAETRTWSEERRASAAQAYADETDRWVREAGLAPARVREGPPPTRFREVLEILLRHEVRFIVIGGYAAVLQGSPIITRDLDVCYARDDENLHRLADALRELGATLRGAPQDLPWRPDFRALKNGDHFTLTTSLGAFDCLGTPAGTTGYGALDPGAVEVPLQGLAVRVASVSDLIRMKMAAGRAKDRAMLEDLGALQEEIDREERERRARRQGGTADHER